MIKDVVVRIGYCAPRRGLVPKFGSVELFFGRMTRHSYKAQRHVTRAGSPVVGIVAGRNRKRQRPDRVARSQNGQSRGRRFRTPGTGVLGAGGTVIRSYWPMRK